nr:immunoglobulin light chain junction region [Macaca mulatta]MOW57108.1 immunoglobulin light chain junction region [Macaca mulatta]MOW59013.1 immunoglobulin light chain junction region [Macaca mulatta]
DYYCQSYDSSLTARVF